MFHLNEVHINQCRENEDIQTDSIKKKGRWTP